MKTKVMWGVCSNADTVSEQPEAVPGKNQRMQNAAPPCFHMRPAGKRDICRQLAWNKRYCSPDPSGFAPQDLRMQSCG